MSKFHTHFLLPFAVPERHAGLPGRLREIQKFERMSEQQQREVQQQRLSRILEHSYRTVPYYRKQFDAADFHPSHGRVDQPLPLPILTRDDLRQRTEELLSNSYKQADLRTSATGGTTSTPVRFCRDLEGLRNKTALQLQLNSWAGYEAGDSVMTLWGAHRDLLMAPSWRWRLYEEVLMRCVSAPSGFINEEILERFRQRYEKHRPKVLYAYTNVLVAFASYLKKHGLQHRPKVLIVTAELLSEPSRKLIESVFDVPVFNHYGSRDVGMISSECSYHTGLHFHPWGCYVEFDRIGDTPDGPAYRLLVTDLLNYGQPFIRYDTGDCVTLNNRDCSCGRWFPQVGQILGRVADGLELADGGIVPGVSVGNHMSQMGQTFRAISQVQFVQKSHEHLHLRYVVKDEHPSAREELKSICSAIDSLANHPFNWTLEKVANIPRERSGKIRLCMSELHTPDSSLAKPLQSQNLREGITCSSFVDLPS